MFFDKMNDAAAKLVAAASKRLKGNKVISKKSKLHKESISDLNEYEVARIDLISYNKVIANFKNGKKREYVRTGRDSWRNPENKIVRSFDLMNDLPYIEGCKIDYIE